MSLDYPNRADWLAKRDTPTGRLARIRRNVRMFWTGGTYKPGRTKQKIRIWDAKILKRLLKRAAKRQA